MSASRQFFDAIDQAKRKRRQAEAAKASQDAISKAKHALGLTAEDTEIECGECAGSGREGGDPDAAVCLYCNGSGVW